MNDFAVQKHMLSENLLMYGIMLPSLPSHEFNFILIKPSFQNFRDMKLSLVQTMSQSTVSKLQYFA